MERNELKILQIEAAHLRKMKNFERLVFAYTSCPLCGEISGKPVLHTRDYLTNSPTFYSIIKCSKCALERTQPIPLPESIDFFYPESYGPYSSSGKKIKRPINHSRNGFLSLIKYAFSIIYPKAKIIPETHLQNSRILDYGCGSGKFLSELQCNNCEKIAVDFSEVSLSKAASLGLRTVNVKDCLSDVGEETCDVVTAFMVFEHLHDPVSHLITINKLLKANGIFILSTPDSASLIRKVFRSYCYDIQTPTHLLHYNKQTLERLITASGLKIKKIVYEPNPNTLFFSISIFLKYNFPIAEPVWQLLLSNKYFRPVKILIGILLSYSRQSGRIEMTVTK